MGLRTARGAARMTMEKAPSLATGFRGAGRKLPLQTAPRGGIAIVHYEERVAEAIAFILGTAKGERVTRPDPGCGIHELVFEPNNDQTRDRVAQAVRRVLAEWEPRIDVMEVRVDTAPDEPDLLLIRVDYRVRATNVVRSLVYPRRLR